MTHDRPTSDTFVSLRARVSDSQAEKLHNSLLRARLSVIYREEQHGASLMVHVRCSSTQEHSVRQLFREFELPVFGENGENL